MKTAEEFALENGAYKTKNGLFGYVEFGADYFVAEIKRIQVDAMKEGMRRAANMARDTGWRYEPLQNRILADAEQLTEKDL